MKPKSNPVMMSGTRKPDGLRPTAVPANDGELGSIRGPPCGPNGSAPAFMPVISCRGRDDPVAGIHVAVNKLSSSAREAYHNSELVKG